MNTRRLAMSLFAILAVGLFAVGCGDDDSGDNGGTTPVGSPTAGATVTAEPPDNGGNAKVGGEVRIQYLEHDSFDPHFTQFNQSVGATGMVFRGLYHLNPDNSPRPEMAADLPEISDDGRTYTITLQDDLVWSDGDDLTADDFVAGIQRTCSFAIGGAYQGVLSNIVGCDEYYDPANADLPVEEQEALREAVGVTAVDAQTLEIQLENPQPTFTIILHMWMTWPIPTHIVSDVNAEWPRPEELAFNGPFAVERYAPGSEMVLARNENYAGEHLAYLDRITLQYIDNLETANNAYRNGELAMTLANTAALSSLQSEFPEELQSEATASTIALYVNLEAPPLDDQNVRLALSKAIDRETLNAVVLQGAHVPTTTWVPPDVIGGGMTTDGFAEAIGFDPEGAAALLEEAGFPGGEGFPALTIPIRDTPSNVGTAEFLQESFRTHLGITVEIQIMDAPSLSARYTSGDFQLFPGGFAQDYPDPESWIVQLYASDSPMNHYNCNNAEIDALIEQAQYNTNNEERLEQYREANELISTTLCGSIPLYHQGNHYLISPELKGPGEYAGSKDRLLAGDWIPEEWYLED